MSGELCTSEATLSEAVSVDSVTPFCSLGSRDAVSMVERVANVVSGISVIGEARNALSTDGWRATIAANRITIGDEVLAQLIPAKAGRFGYVSARWVIYSTAGLHPVWIVGADRPEVAGSPS